MAQGAAQVGGAFTLTDQLGQTVRDSDFRGKLMLVFFGYTHCPDVCPLTVAALSQALKLLGDRADKVVPVFITVDPRRDSPRVIKAYLANFDQRIVGLTGTPEQIKPVAAAYRAFYARAQTASDQELRDHPPGAKQEPGHSHASSGAHKHEHHQGREQGNGHGDYTVEHSGFIYLMGVDGKYVRHFPYNAPAQDIADSVAAHVKQP